MKIIVINGVAQSGKDTFIELFEKYASVGVANISSVDPVKELMEKCGWSPDDKSDAARATMAKIKQSLIDLNDGPFWYVQSQIEAIRWNRPDVGVVFVHVREPEEIEKLKWAFKEKCLTLLVERDVRVPDNTSDKGVMGFDYDLVIQNNGAINELELSAICLVEHLEHEIAGQYLIALAA